MIWIQTTKALNNKRQYLFIAMFLTVVYSQYLLPKNVIKVQVLPNFTGANEYFNATGYKGSNQVEKLNGFDFMKFYTMTLPMLSFPDTLNKYLNWSSAWDSVSVNQVINLLNQDTTTHLENFSPIRYPITNIHSDWGTLKNSQDVNYYGSFVLNISYGVNHFLNIGINVPVKKISISNNFTWSKELFWSLYINDMANDYSSTLFTLDSLYKNNLITNNNYNELVKEILEETKWAFEPRTATADDPLLNGIPASYFPFIKTFGEINDQFIDIKSLTNFYFPDRSGYGIGDIWLEARFKIFESIINQDEYVILSNLKVTFPTGKRVSLYDNQNPTKQFAQINFGLGSYSIGPQIELFYITNIFDRPLCFLTAFGVEFSSSAKTAVENDFLFSFDRDPAITVARLGESYVVNPANILNWKTSTFFDVIPEVLSINLMYQGLYKGNDKIELPFAPKDSLNQEIKVQLSTGDTTMLPLDANKNNIFDSEEWMAWYSDHSVEGYRKTTRVQSHDLSLQIIFKDYSRNYLPIPYELHLSYMNRIAGRNCFDLTSISIGFIGYFKWQ